MKDYKPKEVWQCFICMHPEIESDLESFKAARTVGLKMCKEHLNEIQSRAPSE